MNEQSPFFTIHDELSVQVTQLHSVDASQDQLHVLRCTLSHHREKYDIVLASVIHCENELGIDPGEQWTLNSTLCVDAFKAAAEHVYQ